jgi:hypothetical protein
MAIEAGFFSGVIAQTAMKGSQTLDEARKVFNRASLMHFLSLSCCDAAGLARVDPFRGNSRTRKT